MTVAEVDGVDPVPDARDGPRVRRRPAQRRGPAPGRARRAQDALGRGPRRPRRRRACSGRTRSPPSTTLGTEENNLTDVLRRALRRRRPRAAWRGCSPPRRCCGRSPATTPACSPSPTGPRRPSPTGTRPRSCARPRRIVVSLAGGPPELDAAPLHRHGCAASARRGGASRGIRGRRSAYAMFVDEGEPGATRWRRGWPSLAEDGDPVTAQMALLWASLVAENTGDVAPGDPVRPGGTRAPPARRRTWRHRCTPSSRSSPWSSATTHVPPSTPRSAWPILVRLHADDDARAMRVGSAMAAAARGRPGRRASGSSTRSTDDGREAVLGSQMIAARRARRARAGPRRRPRRVCACFDDAVASVGGRRAGLRRAEPLGADRGVRVAGGPRPARQHRRRRAGAPSSCATCS